MSEAELEHVEFHLASCCGALVFALVLFRFPFRVLFRVRVLVLVLKTPKCLAVLIYEHRLHALSNGPSYLKKQTTLRLVVSSVCLYGVSVFLKDKHDNATLRRYTLTHLLNSASYSKNRADLVCFSFTFRQYATRDEA